MDGIRITDTTFSKALNSRQLNADKEIFQHNMVKSQSKEINTLSDKNNQSFKKVEDIVGKLNESASMVQKKLKYKIHDETDRLMVQVLDMETSKVIKEIPPEKVLDMVAKIEEMIGLIIDEKI